MLNEIGVIYIWREGDKWWNIAQRATGHGGNWPLLVAANPHITNANKVPEGTAVKIPRELAE